MFREDIFGSSLCLSFQSKGPAHTPQTVRPSQRSSHPGSLQVWVLTPHLLTGRNQMKKTSSTTQPCPPAGVMVLLLQLWLLVCSTYQLCKINLPLMSLPACPFQCVPVEHSGSRWAHCPSLSALMLLLDFVSFIFHSALTNVFSSERLKLMVYDRERKINKYSISERDTPPLGPSSASTGM